MIGAPSAIVLSTARADALNAGRRRNGGETGATKTEVDNAMTPYKTTADLPESVRDALPAHAQDIYRAAYDSAWEEYANLAKRRGDESREETAHRVAWAAVKARYAKDEATGRWRARDKEGIDTRGRG